MIDVAKGKAGRQSMARDGGTLDIAQWDDWLEAVRKVKAGWQAD